MGVGCNTVEELIDCLAKAYYLDCNKAAVLACVTDDVLWTGTDPQSVAQGKAALSDLLDTDALKFPNPISLKSRPAQIHMHGKNFATVLAEASLLCGEETACSHSVRTSITAMFEQGKWLACSVSATTHINGNAQLSDNAKLYRTLINESPIGVIVTEKQSRSILFANKAWCRMEGLDPDAHVIGQTLQDVLPAEKIFFANADDLDFPSDHYAESSQLSSINRPETVRSRTLAWEGANAYVCYMDDETESLRGHRQLQRLIDRVPCGIAIFKVISHTISVEYLNDAFFRLLDDTREGRARYFGTGGVEAIHPEDRPSVIEGIDRMHAGCNLMSMYFRIVDGQKRYRWVCLTCSVVQHNGSELIIYGSYSDFEESMRARKAQHNRQQAYEEQINLKLLTSQKALATGFFNITKGTFTDNTPTDPHLANIKSGMRADDVLATIIDAVDVEERPLFEQVQDCLTIMEYYARGKTHYEISHHLLGRSNWYETTFDILTNPTTGDIQAILALSDITNAVFAEKLVSTLVRVDYDMAMTIDMATGTPHQYASGSRHSRLLDMQKEMGDNEKGLEAFLRAYCIDPDVERVIYEHSFPCILEHLEKEPVYTILYSLKLNGKIERKRAIYAYLEDNHRTIVCAVQDATKTYELEEKQHRQLERALAYAKRASRAKADFYSRMSHDMRTPMNVILGLAQLSATESDVNVLHDNFAKIMESGGYLLALVNDTLDYQRIESGKLTLDCKITSRHALWATIINAIEPMAKEKHINLQAINDASQKDEYLLVDSIRMQQIFINLLSNAVKFTPAGGTIVFEVKMIRKEGHILHKKILVKDNGVGMSEDFLNHDLYKPFSQENIEASKNYYGSGLGLSIVHDLVHAMNGRIEVESTLGKGTTFTVYLDLEEVAGGEQIHALDADKKSLDDANRILLGKHILLVEDHPMNAEIAKKLLEKVGCTVSVARDGKLGLQAFDSSPVFSIDAVLMDVRMPEMNGLECSRAIRKLNRPDATTTPILAMTANTYPEDIANALEAKMSGYLAKPVDPAELYKTLARYIDSAPAHRLF